MPQPEIPFDLMSKVRSPTGDRGGGSCAGVARPASTGRQLAASDKHEHTTRDPHSRPSTVSRAGASDTAAVHLAHLPTSDHTAAQHHRIIATVSPRYQQQQQQQHHGRSSEPRSHWPLLVSSLALRAAHQE